MKPKANLNLKLDMDYKKWLPILRVAQPYIFGALLVGVFGYTAYVVNAALNVKPDATAPAAASATAKISFDKKTIQTLKDLDVVEGNVDVGALGKSDPFK